MSIAASEPLVSLIIPTRERVGTLRYTIASALDQLSRDFEVIVSDNASADETRDVVLRFADDRVRYLNTGRRLSMCDNYEFALEQAKGVYVIIIGDDDAVMPGGVDRLVSILHAEPEPVIHMWPLNAYDWPHGEATGRAVYLAPSRRRSELTLKAKARFVISVGGWKYYELPSPYHCAVPRRLLSSLREQTGRVFHSTQPDVFTAMALPAFADRAINVGEPITLHGRSSQSNGLGFVKRSARPNIERFLREYGDYRFHASLDPGVGAAANMIPDAVLVARDMFPKLYAGTTFNYGAMWAYVCRLRFVSHRAVLVRLAHIRRRQPLSLLSFLAYSVIHQVSVMRRSVLNLLTLSSRAARRAPDNIQEFARALALSARSPDLDQPDRRRESESR